MLDKIVQSALRRNDKLLGLDDVVEKEILHHDILQVLQAEGILQQLTFIGGTSLRVCYNSSRLSEDLGFTAGVNFNASRFDGMAEQLQQHLHRKYGLKVDVREPKLTTTDTTTWKITIEKYAGRPDLPSQKMHIDVCALPSFDRQFHSAIDHYGIQSPIASLPLPVQSLDEILADKMVAFAFRQRRIKPRDVWDIMWLKQRGIVQDPALIRRKLEVREKSIQSYTQNTEQHCQLVMADKGTELDFKREMSRFLPQDIRTNTLNNPNFWGAVGREIVNDVTHINDMLKGKESPKSAKFKM
ncbi:Domain of unknown function DUF1814 [Glaciecola sp. 4H-3-7+YE-5]|nr:Domain of unknown function DUF1814 [Glaciecola sp. 4H-3-7+YE-5]